MRKQNKRKVNIIALTTSSEQDEKVQSAAKKVFLEKDLHSKEIEGTSRKLKDNSPKQ